MENLKPLSVYIHIPFCKSKCYYCDFKSFVNNDEYFEQYVETLKEEIKSFDFTGYIIETIFLGGGTPTVLPSENICEIIESFNSYKMTENVEITIECNPATADFEYFSKIKNVGVNRLSIGIQSTSDEVLAKIGRVHKFQDVISTVKDAKKAGFSNINGDLIMSLPNQSVSHMEKTISDVLELDLKHFSVYSLIIEEDTVFGKLNDDEFHKLNLPTEDVDRETYHKVCEILKENNYKQYEISNFSKEGFSCKHNINYWNRCEYIGFGVASHSFVDGKRFSNTDSLANYLDDKGKTKHGVNKLSKEDEIEEFIFLGLRMLDGINVLKFEKEFNEDFEFLYGKTIEKMQKLELLERKNSMIKLTNKGIDVSEAIIFDIITKTS